MINSENEQTTHKKIREEVTGGKVVEKIFKCPLDDLKLVLKDWEKLKENFKDLSIKISLSFFNDHPYYRNFFPSFAMVNDEDLESNTDFLLHAYAIVKGINSIMMSFSGYYEEDNEILPVIGTSHQKRNVTSLMMHQLKDNVLSTCCEVLKLNKEEESSWKSVLDFIFGDYVCRFYSEEVLEKKDDMD